MRKRLILAALLCGTCWPSVGRADPVTAFVGGFLNAMGAGTFLASGAVGAWGAGFTAGSFLTGTFIGRTIMAVGLNLASAAVMRQRMPQPSERLVNFAQPVSHMERIYGRVKKGGPLGLTFRQGEKRHYAVIIAAHSTVGPVEHWLDTRQVTIDSAGIVETSPMDGVGSIRTYTGQPGQAADAQFMAASAQVTAAHDFAGLSYAALWAKGVGAKKFAKCYPSGREWAYSAVWDGWDQIYDPRSDSYGWTNNAALVIAHEILFSGRGVDWDNVAEEADVSDQLVINGDGGTQARWTINGTLDDSMDWETVRGALQLACDAWFDESDDGVVRFKVGRFQAPDLILTERDFLALEITENGWGPDVFGQFAVRYVEPLRNWIETPCGAVVFDASGPRYQDDAFLISNHNQAYRVAHRLGCVARAKYALRGVLKLIGYEVIGRRFVRVQAFGFDVRVEVSRLVREGGGITFQFEGRSVTAADFAPSPENEPDRQIYAEIASDDAVPEVVGLTAEVIYGAGGQGLISLEWPAQDDSYRQDLRWRSAAAGVPEWQVIELDSDQASYAFSPPQYGVSYDWQIRNVSNAGRISDWAPGTAISITALVNASPPPALQSFSASEVSGDVLLSILSPNSARYAATRFFRATGSTSFADAMAIHQEYGAANAADSHTDPAPGVGSHSYWAEPLNSSGVPGPRSGPQTVTIS